MYQSSWATPEPTTPVMLAKAYTLTLWLIATTAALNLAYLSRDKPWGPRTRQR